MKITPKAYCTTKPWNPLLVFSETRFKETSLIRALNFPSSIAMTAFLEAGFYVALDRGKNELSFKIAILT